MFGSEGRSGTNVPVSYLKHDIPLVEIWRSNDQNTRAQKVLEWLDFATDTDNPPHNGFSKIVEASLDCT